MTELKRYFLIFVTTPFMLMGMVWQIVAGGFYAGRMTTTAWTAKLAKDVLISRLGSLGASDEQKHEPNPRREGPRMH